MWLRRLAAVAAVLVAVAGPAAADDGLSIAEILQLRQLGFSEADIREEVLAAGGDYALDDADRAALDGAGLSPDFVAFLESLEPVVRLGNADVVAMIEAEAATEEVLRAIAAAERDFDVSPRAMLTLAERAPRPVVLAVRGRPVGLEDLRELVAEGFGPETLLLLLDVTGNEPVDLTPAAALELVREGLPAEVVARLRQPVAAPAAAENLPGPGYYPHPMDLFALRYPTDWRLLRELHEGSVNYVLTPERGSGRAADLDIAFEFGLFPVDEASVVRALSVEESLERLLPLIRAEEPGLEPVGAIEAVELGGRRAARATFAGTIKDRGPERRFKGSVFMAASDDFLYLAVTRAPEERYEELAPVFEDIVARSRMQPTPPPPRRATPFPAHEIVERYRPAVVLVRVRHGDQEGSGTGFIVREDGYVITNEHVVASPDTGRPAETVTIEWDEELGRAPERARVLGARRTPGVMPIINWGVDVALLKLEGQGPYPTVPVTRLGEVQLGDPLLTIGFPAQALMPTVSSTITSGILTRINRDATGRVEGLYTDAAMTKGNSGGPLLSLVTGGVMGINSYGVDTRTAQILGPGGELLINFHGATPIDDALREFPVATMLPREREQSLDELDYYDLAQRASTLGATVGAVALAEQAVERSGGSADSLQLLGLLQAMTAVDLEGLQAGLDTLGRALQADPRHVPTLITLGQLQAELGDPLSAMRYINSAIRADPDSWAALLIRAGVNLELRNFEAVHEDLDRVAELSAGLLPEPFELAGKSYYAQERYQEGRESFLRAVETNPLRIEARIGAGRYFELTGNPISALLEYEAIEEEHPGTPAVLVAMGRAFAAAGRPGDALEHFQRAISQAVRLRVPPDPEAFLAGGALARDHAEEPRVAFRLFARFLEHYFEHARAYEAHIGVAGLIGRQLPTPARTHLRLALQQRPDDEEIGQHLQRIPDQPLTIEQLQAMRELGYPEELAARIIAESPLGFEVRSREAIAELAGQFPVSFVVGVLIAQDRQDRAREQAGPQSGQPQQPPQPQEQPQQQEGPPERLLGHWVADVPGQDGQQVELYFIFDPSWRYAFFVTAGGQEQRDDGAYRIVPESRILFTSDGGQEFVVPVELRGEQLVLTDPNSGEVVYSRPQQR